MRFFALFALSLTPSLSALTIQIDYTYDTTNFFDTQEKKDAIEAVAKFYGDRIEDNLLRIDPADFAQASWNARPRHPATGATINIPNLVVPEDTVIVYVGARELGGSTRGIAGPGGFSAGGFTSWFERLRGRGSANASFPDEQADLNTDFSLWGGSIAFDITTNWNFSLTENQSGTEFLKIALHEMGHVLGIGTADSWDNLISGGTFTGAAAINSYGSAPPADLSHFQEEPSSSDLLSPLYGSFGTTHGSSIPVLMLPSSLDTGSNFEVITDLDLAALVDIGWELTLPISLETVALSPGTASLTWPSSSFCTYEIERGSDLLTFPAGSGEITGDGSLQTWSDPTPPSDKAFYRLSATSSYGVTKTRRARSSAAPLGDYTTTIVVEGREVSGCFCEEHSH